MRTSIISSLLLISFAILCPNKVTAQKFAHLDKSPMDAASYPSSYRETDKIVKIIYSRPQLKGRKLTKLVPNDKVWRTGANEAVEITFYKDVVFGDKPVKAGTYSLFTIPNEREWTIILNKAKNVWGAYFYNKDEDVLRIQAPVTKSKKHIEVFSIAFDGEENEFNMYIGWSKTLITVPLKIEG